MLPYRPEGLYATPPNPELLRRSAGTGEIFRAMCTKCDENHDLHVDLGPITGIIPRKEAALSGFGEYTVLSRVGKPVSFQVLDFDSRGRALLSRRAAQEDARSFFLSALRPGDIIPAVVQNPTNFGVFCDIGCGFTALMPIARCCISRLDTTAALFHPGQSIYAAIFSIDDHEGRLTLTGRELLGTWEENAAFFRPGQTVTGTVRSHMPYGIFIELTPNLSGLCEPDPSVKPGDSVSVYIRSIQPDSHKIKLSIVDHLPPQPHRPLRYFLNTGHLRRWEYHPGGSITVF